MGLERDAIRCKLLLTGDGKDLNFDQAYASALRMKAAQEQSEEVRCTNEVTASTSVKGDGNWQRKCAQRQDKKNFPVSRTYVACTRCGRAHGPKKCPHFKSKC